jgi:osomolarity two-component system sensor histidine kinase NIK1
MCDRLRALAAEVTRVTLEVGSQGKLGGQAHVPDVEGVWFELVRNVRPNILPFIARNLTRNAIG